MHSTAIPDGTATSPAAGTPTAPPPSPGPILVISCSASAGLQPSPIASPNIDLYASEAAAVRAAVAGPGYPVASIASSPLGFPCGVPFASSGSLCPIAGIGGPTAYVRFGGTDRVAALTLQLRSHESVTATVEAFEVPPPAGTAP